MSVCLLAVSIPTLFSTTVSGDQDLVIYTDYYQYDNNESLVYHIVGTNNTTYTVLVVHRDSDTPLKITHKRTGINETMVNGTMPLYGLTNFGVMELRAFNKSYNQSAKCEFRLVPSQAWWDDEVDEMVGTFYEIQFWMFYVMFVTIIVILSGYLYFYLKYRAKVKEQLGESGIFEGLHKVFTSPGDYDYYANAVEGERPTGVKAKAELAHMRFKTARWEFIDNLKTIKDAKELEPRQSYLSRELQTNLVKDVIKEKERAGILPKGRWEQMTSLEKFTFLNPAEIRKATKG